MSPKKAGVNKIANAAKQLMELIESANDLIESITAEDGVHVEIGTTVTRNAKCDAPRNVRKIDLSVSKRD